MATGQDVVLIAAQHLGEDYYWSYRVNNNNPNDRTYALMRDVDLNNPSYSGPWDCAEFVTYCVYRAYGLKFGLLDSVEGTAAQESHADAWRTDAVSLSSQFTEIPLSQARNTPGAILIANSGSHVALTVGDNTRIIEANVDQIGNTYFRDGGIAVDPSLYGTLLGTPVGQDIGDVKYNSGFNWSTSSYKAYIIDSVDYGGGGSGSGGTDSGGDNGNTFSTATLKNLPYSSNSASVGFAGDTNDFIKFEAQSNGTVNAHLSGLSADLDLIAFNSLQSELDRSAAGGTANEHVQFSVVGGQTYVLHVAPYLAAATSYALTVTFVPSGTSGGGGGNGGGGGTGGGGTQPPAGAGTISVPTFVELTEGNSGTKFASVIITRTGGSAPFAVDIQTADGSATVADGDYVPKVETVQFGQGDTAKTAQIAINGDTKVEDDDSFFVSLWRPTNGAEIAKSTSVVIIHNDDTGVTAPAIAGTVAVPTFVELTEGDSGTKFANVTITRTGGSAAFAVDIETADGSATVADGDYVPKVETVQFGQGEVTKTVQVAINGDTNVEDNDSFFVSLWRPTNGASISTGDGTSVVIIHDDDTGLPAPAVAGTVAVPTFVELAEGDSGTKFANVTITRTGGSAAFAVDIETADGSATVADGDYVPKVETVQFGQGEVTKTVQVAINGDTNVEDNDSFFVSLWRPTNGASISTGDGTSVVIIHDDDTGVPAPAVAGTVAVPTFVELAEGDSGTKFANVTITRSGGSAPFAVDIETADGSATVADGDYVPKVETVQFGQGEVTKTLQVAINGDTNVEDNDSFFVSLWRPTNGANIAPGDGTSVVIINNDDTAQQPPEAAGSVQIQQLIAVHEGNGGSQTIGLLVTRSGGAAPFSVDFATKSVGQAAVDDGDYLESSGTLNFEPGTHFLTVPVTILGDTKIEGDELLLVELSRPTNGATLGNQVSIVAIANDDFAPPSQAAAGLVRIQQTSVVDEGNVDSKVVNLVVSRSGGTEPFSVDFETVEDGSAFSGDQDFLSTAGTLHFGQGVITQTIPVVINGDTRIEDSENFSVRLQRPTNGASITDATATVTIVTDDSVGQQPIPAGQDLPAAVRLATGDRLVARADVSGEGVSWIFQRFDDFGNALAGAITFAPSHAMDRSAVKVAAQQDGGFAIVWGRSYQVFDRHDIPVTPELSHDIVVVTPHGAAGVADVVTLDNGSFAIFGNAGESQIIDFAPSRTARWEGPVHGISSWQEQELLSRQDDTRTLFSSAGVAMKPWIANFDAAGQGDVNANANDLANHMIGNSGANVFITFGGNDVLYGFGGDDWLLGQHGYDLIDGGDGDDVAIGGLGNDSIASGPGADTVAGDDGDDAIDAGDGADQVFGGSGNDLITGSAGADTLKGGAGRDEIDGAEGADTIWGDRDADTLDGGAGPDSFVFASGSGNDRITDFHWSSGDPDSDTIVIAVEPGSTLNGLPVSPGSLLAGAVDALDGVLLMLGPGHTVLLEGVARDALTEDSFSLIFL